jgi:hypothetical protein
MNARPPEPTRLTNAEKNAYRSLLYWMTLNTRNVCPPYAPISRNPLVWWKQYRQGRAVGALADWLHNLAWFAANDFTGFDANWFWAGYDSLCERFDEARRLDYRKRYEDDLSRRSEGSAT